MSKGYVYVLSNPSMPGLVKVGRSESDPQIRAAQLYTTGVPEPFEIEFVWFCEEHEELEKGVHAAFSQARKSGREFFEAEPIDIIEYIVNYHIGDYGLTITSEIIKTDADDLHWVANRKDMHHVDLLRSVSAMPLEVLRQYLWEFCQSKYEKEIREATTPSNVIPLGAANG